MKLTIKSTTAQGELETLDAALFRALQHDGRATIQALAEKLGTSREFITQRLRYLHTEGGLRVVAALDPGFVGHNILVHVKVEVAGSAATAAALTAALPDAVFVSVTSGSHALVFETRHGSSTELQETLDQIRTFPGVRKLLVSTYTEVLQGFFVPRERSEATPDEIDIELISLLQIDGRASFRALASQVHLSPSSTRARVQRLIEAGVIRISAIRSGGISRSRLATGIGVTVAGDTKLVRQFFTESPSIDFAACSHGSYDFIATLIGESTEHLLEALDEIRLLPGVTSVNSWTHFDVVKEDYGRSLGRVLEQQAAAPQPSN